MSVTYSVFLNRASIPDAAALEAVAREIAPAFALAEPYDFLEDTGWCPCLLNGRDAGFEWELEPNDPEASGLAEYDSEALLSFRSAEADRHCVVIVAAAIAARGGGQIVPPLGESIEAGAAVEWAKQAIAEAAGAAKRRMRASKKAKAKPPEELLSEWLGGLAGAKVDRVVHALPGDPSTGIRFETGVLLMTRRWAWRTDDGEAFSTLELPREASPAELRAVSEGQQRLTALLRQWTLRSASLDAESLVLSLDFDGGRLTAHPRAPVYRTEAEALFACFDAWELKRNDLTLRAEPEQRRVLLR
jgi:hypothetical protein